MAGLKKMSLKKAQKKFLEEVANENIEEVKKMLSSFEHFNFKTYKYGHTALHLAVLHKNLQMLELLLSESKTNINARGFIGETPLFLAVKVKHYEGCLRLIQAGADVNLTTHQKFQLMAPLHLAVEKDSMDILELLLCQDNIDVNVQKYDKETPLIVAIALSNFQAVKLLVQAGANINNILKNKFSNTNTALHYAVELNLQEILHYLLLQPDIKLEIRNDIGETPLFMAVTLGLHKAAELLIESGADVNVYSYNDDNRHSLLHVAVRNNDQEILHYLLLQPDIKLDIRNKSGETPLFMAVKLELHQAAELLIESGADVNVCGYNDDNRDSLLHVALRNNDLKMLNIISTLDRLDKINFRNVWGETPLYLAAKSGWYEAIQLLVRNGANVNMFKKSRRVLSLSPVPDFDSFLFSDSEIFFERNIKTKTPLFVSVRYPKCADLLISCGAHLDALNNDQKYTALHQAVKLGCLETVCMLLYYNADANIVSLQGTTPFMYSFKYRMTEEDQQIQDIILEYVTDFNVCNSIKNETAFELALKINSPNVKKIFERGGKIRAHALLPCINAGFPDKNNFKLIWDNLKYDIYNPISITMLLNMATSRFKRHDIEDLLNIVIESPNVDLLLKSTSTPFGFKFDNYLDMFGYRHNYRSSVFSFKKFIRTFYIHDYNEDLLMKLIFRLEENSFLLTTDEISIIFSCYGYGELIKLLRYVDYYGRWRPTDTMVRLIFDVHSSVDDIKKDFIEYCHRAWIGNQMADVRRLLSLAEDVVGPSMPKLIELARNKTREFIVQAYNIHTPCQYYTTVDHLNIPLVCKQILKFEKQLYYIKI